MSHTVGSVARLAGITVRTLHHQEANHPASASAG
jgi:DNA-binding transcriptional MerR regulator